MRLHRALVLGGSGFIGRHLTTHLASEGWDVYATDPQDRAEEPPPKAHNIVIKALDVGGIRTAVEASDPRVVFNLAAAGVGPSDRSPETLIMGNAGIVSALMTALSSREGVRVLHTGSWSEYADPTTSDPITEQHPIAPSSVYGAAKAGASLLGLALSNSLGIPFTVLRLFNVYGEGEAPHRLLPFIVDRLGSGETVDLTSGSQVRDFVHVADVATALGAAAKADLPTAAFNVATGIGTPVRQVALMAAAVLGAPEGSLRFGALESRSDEPAIIIGDPAHFAAATEWSPAMSVADGVRRTIEAIRNRPTRPQT